MLGTFLLLCALISGTNFHVSPKGNDAWPGTEQKPFRSLERARNAIKGIRTARGIPKGGVTIWIHAGIYYRHSTFKLGPGDSGESGAPVTYRAAVGETVRITGGRNVPTELAVPVSDKDLLRRFPEAARPHIVEIDLWQAEITEHGTMQQIGHGLAVPPAPLEIFFNHKALPLVRYPNSGTIPMGTVVDQGSVPAEGDTTLRGGSFRYTDPRHARWIRSRDAWIRGTLKWGWADDMIRISAIDTATRRVILSTPHMYGIGSGKPYQHYIALNLPEELDTAGEWYIDRTGGKLYLWPPEDFARGELTASVLEQPVIALDKASHIILRDLIIEDSRGIGLTIEGGEENVVAGCVFRNLGTLGILFGQGARQTAGGMVPGSYDGVPQSGVVGTLQNQLYTHTTWNRNAGRKHRIVSCDFSGTGTGAVFMGGGDKKDLIAGDNTIENCRIRDYNRRLTTLWAGISVDGCGNRVLHNEISDSPCQAIVAHGNEHLFEYNLIHHVAMEADDASAWYMGRDPSDRGNIVRYNFFHSVGRTDRMIMGVYLDDATCGTTVHGNVFYRVGTSGCVFSNAGHDNTVTNNIFIDSPGPAVFMQSMWYDWAKSSVPAFFGPKGVFRQRLLESVNITAPPYRVRYPGLADWLDLLPDQKTYVGMRPRRNIMEKNLIVRCPETLRLNGEYAQFDERNNYSVSGDPGFVNPSALDFRLRPESAAFKKIPGFSAIPFEKIGIQPDEFRRDSKRPPRGTGSAE